MAKTDVQAVEMVRRIRDEQAAFLAQKDEAAVLEFFRLAGETAKDDARKRMGTKTESDPVSDPPQQPTRSAGG